LNNKKDEIILGGYIRHVLVNEEIDSSTFLSFFFRVLTFLFLLPALIVLLLAHSWLGFGIFLGSAILFGLVAYYFRAKTITLLSYYEKNLKKNQNMILKMDKDKEPKVETRNKERKAKNGR